MKRLEKVMTAQTTTYKTDYDGFFLDVVRIDNGWGYELEAWIYHKDYGVKRFVFGVNESGHDIQGFVWAAMEGLEEDVKQYREKVFDDVDD